MTKEQMIAAISSLNVGDSRALEKRGGAFKDLLKEIVNSIPSDEHSVFDIDYDGDVEIFTISTENYNNLVQEFRKGKNVYVNCPTRNYVFCLVVGADPADYRFDFVQAGNICSGYRHTNG